MKIKKAIQQGHGRQQKVKQFELKFLEMVFDC